MDRNIGTWLLSAIALFLCVPFLGYGQEALLRVTTDSAGNVAGRGQHIYLLVHDDGEVQFVDGKMDGGELIYFSRRSKISDDEISELRAFLNSSGIRDLGPKFEPLFRPLDHWIELRISIKSGDINKEIVVINFEPEHPRASAAYPPALIDLMCQIERYRKMSSCSLLNLGSTCD